MKDYKKILEGVVSIINTTEKSDIGFANICTYIGEKCPELAESEDEGIRKALITYFSDEDESYDGIPYPNIRAWLEKQGEQKPQRIVSAEAKEAMYDKPAWNEEDEKCIDDLLHYLEHYSILTSEREKCINWLKSLKPQPKQEWSQNDIDMIGWLIRSCEKEHEELCNDKYGHQDIVSDLKRDCRKKWNWLESLKNKVVPQNKWKPSKELLDVFIKNATDFFESNFNPLTDGGVIGAFDDKEKMIEEFKEYMKEEGFNEEWI